MLIACPGLDRVGRGFETLARECFEALRAEGSLDVMLAKGDGRRHDRELVAPTLHRGGAAARSVGRALGTNAYDVEQACFAVGLLPQIARRRPQVVCVSDLLVSRLLARSRSRWSFKLVLSNGGPYPPGLMRHADHIHQPTAPGLQFALDAGEPPERHTHIVEGVAMPAEGVPRPDERRRLRVALGLPEDRPIVLSVAALDRHHKRADYLVEEIASLPAPRPYLLLLGGEGPEAPGIRSLAASLLGERDHSIRSVPSEAMPDFYRAADVFALASTWEAFGRVMVEALSHGLPCIAHDGPVQRFVLGPHGVFGDLNRRGELARLVERACRSGPPREDAARERHRFAHERFSWDVLAPLYADLLRKCAADGPAQRTTSLHS